MSENFYTPFTEGAIVYDFRKGNDNPGRVIEINRAECYGVHVEFKGGAVQKYTFDGKEYRTDARAVLYTKPITVINSSDQFERLINTYYGNF